MARNTEKANLMFNRWANMKEEMTRGDTRFKDRRPFLASECKSLPDAEKWRREVLREITKKVAEIQNAGLGEARIRDLNDEINKLMREKVHWERQIKHLGGPDYAATAPKLADAEGTELPGGGGYKYFGAAKELPGVRQLFEQAKKEAPKRSRAEISRGITPDYYGYRDEEDGVLLAAEARMQAQLQAQAAADWEAAKAARAAAGGGSGDAMEDVDGAEDAADGAGGGSGGSGGAGAGGGLLRSHVVLPTQEEIAARLLEKKKAILLAKYGIADSVVEGAGKAGGGKGAGSSGGGRGGGLIDDDA